MDDYMQRLGKFFGNAIATLLVTAVVFVTMGGVILLLKWVVSWF